MRGTDCPYLSCPSLIKVLSLKRELACSKLSVEKAMAPHSSTLAWKISWMEKPGRLQSMGSLRVGHDWATSISLFTFMHWRRKWQPTPVFLPGESQGRGSLVGYYLVSGVTQSWTWLKWLSSSSSSKLYNDSKITISGCFCKTSCSRASKAIVWIE